MGLFNEKTMNVNFFVHFPQSCKQTDKTDGRHPPTHLGTHVQEDYIFFRHYFLPFQSLRSTSPCLLRFIDKLSTCQIAELLSSGHDILPKCQIVEL
jgi:hypothetical protein